MKKPAKLVSCTRQADGTWVAVSSAGRKFVGSTKEEAEKMLHDYESGKEKKA